MIGQAVDTLFLLIQYDVFRAGALMGFLVITTFGIRWIKAAFF